MRRHHRLLRVVTSTVPGVRTPRKVPGTRPGACCCATSVPGGWRRFAFGIDGGSSSLTLAGFPSSLVVLTRFVRGKRRRLVAITTYQAGLVLATTYISNTAMPREAAVTYAWDDGSAVVSADVIANALQLAFATAFDNGLDTACAVERTTVLLGDGSDTPLVGESSTSPVSGLANTSSPPPNVACLIRKRTGSGGRGNRGRMYMPWFLNEGSIDEAGMIAGADVASRQAMADAWLADLDDNVTGQHLVIANRIYDEPWTNPNRVLLEVVTGLEVTSLVVDDRVATQRRRLGR